ncbi:unnamed protein product [Orchesella dallaii]|uniref:Uncharacterized protein n=1 Tax=Orchesella dallaii TaxID=48710 RepID=A0ABP1QNH7_9HEXA
MNGSAASSTKPNHGEGEDTPSDIPIDFECYMKWIGEYLPMVPQHLKTIASGSKQFIASILELKPMSQEEETLFRRVTDMCWKLNMAAQYTWVMDYESAFKCVKMAKDELAFHVESTDIEPSSSHIEAYEYAIDTSIAALLRAMVNTHGLSIAGSGVMDTSVFSKRWEALNSNTKSKAVIVFLKACLMTSLRIDDTIVLDKLKEAAALEPDFHAWYRYIYRKIRHLRRSDMRRNLPPSDDEKDACKKAYDLRPDLGDNISNMASLREEELRASRRTLSSEEVKRILLHLTELLESSPNLDTDPWVKIRLAEIYGLRDYALDPSHGEKLFKECTEQWPLNTMVWHKAGKFYHLGGVSRGGGPFVNYDKAKEYYKRSLELRGSNFPCLMDYLKLLRQPFDAIDKMVDEIDYYLPMMKNEAEIRRLIIIKGIILWIHYLNVQKQTLACTTWLTLIKEFPSAAVEVAQSVKAKRNEIVGLLDINTHEIVELLTNMRDDIGTDDSFDDSIQRLITELTKTPRRATELNTGPRTNEVSSRPRAKELHNGPKVKEFKTGPRTKEVSSGHREQADNYEPEEKEERKPGDEIQKESKDFETVKLVTPLPGEKSIVCGDEVKCETNSIAAAVQKLSFNENLSTLSEPINVSSSASIYFIGKGDSSLIPLNGKDSSPPEPLRFVSRGRGRPLSTSSSSTP